MALNDLLADEDYREALAEQAYYRERAEEAAVDAEVSEDRCAYFALAWPSVSDAGRRPYRTAVAETCDHLLSLLAAEV